MCMCLEGQFLSHSREASADHSGGVMHSSSYRVPGGGLTGAQLVGIAHTV